MPMYVCIIYGHGTQDAENKFKELKRDVILWGNGKWFKIYGDRVSLLRIHTHPTSKGNLFFTTFLNKYEGTN